MGKFNLSSLLNNQPHTEDTRPEDKPKKAAFEVVMVSIFDIVPSENNFYSTEQIQELKTSIELAGGIKQNLLVVPIGGGKYKAIAGHRRRLASIALVEEGKPQYELVPCKIEENEEDARTQADREELLLILTNSQREKTDWEKMEEVRRLRIVLERYKKTAKVSGSVRGIIAEALKTSGAQVGRFDAISKHLIPEFKEKMKRAQIGLSAAYELSGLSEERQKEAFAEYADKGSYSIKDAKQKKTVAADTAGQKRAVAADTEGQKRAVAAGQEKESEKETPLPGQMFYNGTLHDATPPVYSKEQPSAEQLKTYPTAQAVAEASKDQITPVLEEADETKSRALERIDAAIKVLLAASDKEKNGDNPFSLAIKALEFYKQKEGWEYE